MVGGSLGGLHRYGLALLVVLVSLASGGLPTPVRAVSQATSSGPAPAASYKLDATVDLDQDTLTATETVQFRNVVGIPLDTIVLRVVANAAGLMDLGAVTVDGLPIVGKLDGSVLELPLGSPLPPGGSTRIELRYTLTIPNEPGRLMSTRRAMALGYWFPILAVHRGEWDRRPFVDVGDALFTEVADFDVTITTNRPAQVIATGQRVAPSSQERQDGRRSRFTAASVRDFAVAISPEYTFKTAVVKQAIGGNVTVEVGAFGEQRAAYFASRAADFLRWAGEKLGPYPYPVLSIADADLPVTYGGLEYPGLVLLSRGYGVSSPPEGTALDGLLAHEIMHQWFYALVGNDQIADPWLDEAFATYLAYAFYRDTRPDLAPAVYDRTIAGSSGGMVDTSVYDYPSDPPYFGVVYRRGARFLDRLQQTMGSDAFWALIREHVDTYRDRVASPRAFLDRAQSLSPTPLGPLISEYLGYGAFRTATPRTWTVEAPASPWTGAGVGRVALFVAADFPVTRVQVWLDARKLADGAANNLALDLTGVEAGSYVLLVKVWDHDTVLFERARRVEIAT